MKQIHAFDVFMISLGLVVLVAHYGLEKSGYQEARRFNQRQQQLAAMQPVVLYEKPKPALTIPAGSPYQNLTPPAGAKVNPFTEIERIATGPSSENPANKDADIRVLLEQHKHQDYHFILQQQAANEMLRHGLFQLYYQDPTDKKVLKAIAFYVEQLEEARSEDTKLMYMGLKALSGFWTKEKIAEVALATAVRVQTKEALAQQDTSTAHGHHRHVYARELKKIGNRHLPTAQAE